MAEAGSHAATPAAIEMIDISKAFGGVHALEHVDLTLRDRECLALVGENGAGKSTLIKILTGVVQKDNGTILVHGKKSDIPDARTAQQLGIGVIHQEFNLIPYLTVAQNMFLGREFSRRRLLLNDRAAVKGAKQILDRLEVDIHAHARVVDLTVGEKQLVEIARALSQNARILIMDEPTASLTEKEIKSLFSIIGGLRSQGVSIVYISHRLEEIFEVADEVAVLRNGRNVGQITGKASTEQIVNLMLGRDIGDKFNKKPAPLGEVLIELRGLSTDTQVKDINLHVRKGEILGIFGIAGAGQRDLSLAMFGMRKLVAGEVLIRGKPVKLRSPSAAIRAGIALLTESRKEEGLLPEMAISQNITLSELGNIAVGGFIPARIERNVARSFFQKLQIRAAGLQQRVKFLSGGNQQKVVLARALATAPEVVILNEPTRGVDVGAKVEIYDLMGRLAAEGKALILISSELPEVLGMSDRIMVLYRGRFVAEVPRSLATQPIVLAHAMGASHG